LESFNIDRVVQSDYYNNCYGVGVFLGYVLLWWMDLSWKFKKK